jgi:hypothetical protein
MYNRQMCHIISIISKIIRAAKLLTDVLSATTFTIVVSVKTTLIGMCLAKYLTDVCAAVFPYLLMSPKLMRRRKVKVFCDVMPHQMVSSYQRLGGRSLKIKAYCYLETSILSTSPRDKTSRKTQIFVNPVMITANEAVQRLQFWALSEFFLNHFNFAP